MSDFEAPDDKALEQAREAFAARQVSREMLSESEDDSSKAISMSRLYAYAEGRIAYPDPEIETALATSPSLRAANSRLLAAGPVYEFELARAASDGDLLPRRGEGCTIRYEDSRAERDHVYVVIEIEQGGGVPAQLVLFDPDDNCHRFDLPAPRRGIVQLLVERGSELLELLRNPTTRVLLR
jgi:hypothetical protein